MKKMFVVLAVLILSIGFIGCSSPTDPGNGGGVSIPTALYGEWKSTDANLVTYDFLNPQFDGNGKSFTIIVDESAIRYKSDEDPSSWRKLSEFAAIENDGDDYIFRTNSDPRLGTTIIFKPETNNLRYISINRDGGNAPDMTIFGNFTKQ